MLPKTRSRWSFTWATLSALAASLLSTSLVWAAGNGEAATAISAALDRTELLRVFGFANEFKEGDLAIGVAAPDEAARLKAREALAALPLSALDSSRFVEDDVSAAIMESLDAPSREKTKGWTVGQLKQFLLESDEAAIKGVRDGLTSEAIAAVAKLLDDDQLVLVSSKVWNPLPGSTVGAQGYFGSRIQPNSPTDDPEEVLFSVLEGFSYGCGDVVLGINPVDSTKANVLRLEETLREIVTTFGLQDKTTWCVLAHIDDQMGVNQDGLVNVGFQSIGGTAKTNATFNVDVAKLLRHLSQLSHMYFETGQGSAFTNNAAEGVDMVTLEARAYGLARALKKKTGNWTIVNDVAGFIGPEVFATGKQLTRACLEDLFMGKLHGLTMGLDICSTYHMGVEIDELDQAMDRVIAAGPAYYMAVAGKSDPMLSYITTAYRDHPRLREKHGRKVSEAMKPFFVSLGVMDDTGKLTDKAGDTGYVYVRYRKAKGDARPEPEILEEAGAILKKLQHRTLDLGHGHDGSYGMPPAIKDRLYRTYGESKRVLFLDLTPEFLAQYPDAVVVETTASDRKDYVLHPPKGEVLSEAAVERLRSEASLDGASGSPADVHVVISEGLNAESITAPGQLEPFLEELAAGLARRGLKQGKTIIVKNGRVRAGYQVGQILFGGSSERKAATVHVIGERPGNGQNTYSAYIGCVPRLRWKPGINHDVVKVVSGVSTTATPPSAGAALVLEILDQLFGPPEAGPGTP